MNKNTNNIIKRVIFPIADFIMKTNVIHYYVRIRNMRTWSPDRIENWQNQNLQKIIHYAYNNTDYYKELFDKNGIKPAEIKTKKDLTKIPILTRKLIIDNFGKIKSREINNISHKIGRTGGTTGEPLTYLMDNITWSFSNANNIINWEKTKYIFGQKYAAIGSTSIFVNKHKSLKHKLFYKFKNKVELDGMKMTDDDIRSHIKLIKKNKIKFIYGYTSAIYILAKYVVKNEISMQITACFPTSEILLDSYREVIIEAFNCTVVNCYGANDGGITAYEHVKESFEVGYSTIIRVDNSEELSNSKGPILVTSLLNKSIPMINYQLGDEVKIKENGGDYNGQVIEKVYGRTSDTIELENGNVLTGFSYYEQIFNLPVQAWDLSKIGKNSLLCKVIRLPDYGEDDERKLISKLKDYAGSSSIIKVEYYDKFEIAKNGKRNYFLN